MRVAEADRGERDDRLTTADREEAKQLRKETAELRRANEILKAAGVFCPGDRPSPDEAEQVIDHLREKGLGVSIPPAGCWTCHRPPVLPARRGRSLRVGFAMNSSCR
ncbi:hypothetical protein [Streptomyces sp. NPDC001315]|uniref:hypothetical protein n=1 Tax=Streptomyces sp. NPDC001315 TaxID=3364562 RepID=UPI0036A54787